MAYFEKQNQPNIQHYNVILSGGLLKSCYMRKFISYALTKKWLFRRMLVKLVNISEYSNIIMTCSDIYIPEFTSPLSTPFFSSDNLKVGFAISTYNVDNFKLN